MPKKVTETATITAEAAAAAKDSGRMPVQFISPGWGSSGYYGAEVLEQAVTDKVIPAGTHMYADHPTDTEHYDRPERSIKDLMAVTVEDARLSTDGALVGEVQVVPAWRDLVETVRDHIGVSIRGSATDIVEGEAEGRRGGIIEGLVAPVLSVDFVTRAGRGGKILPLLESARANKRALDRGVEEATVNDTREALQNVLRDAYGDDDSDHRVWVYVRDFSAPTDDNPTVWFEIESGDDAGTYGQAYTQDDNGAVALTGDRVEVRVTTTYVPATRPDSPEKSTTESHKEIPMGKIQVEESEHRALTEKAGRVDTLESERNAAVAERDELRAAEADRKRREAASAIIGEAKTPDGKAVEFTALETRGLMASLPVIESGEKAGELDVAKFTETVTDAVKVVAEADAKARQAAGEGRVRSFGAPQDGDQPPARESRTSNPWGRSLTESQKGA